MNDTMIKMYSFMDTCYEIESSCAEMYFLFAKQFTADVKISRLWNKTAMEEEYHALHVQMAKKMVTSINWVCLESWRNATAALDMVKQFSCSVRESPPTLRDAMLMALSCEYRMESLHMQNAILVEDKCSNSMFKVLIEADHGHIVMLQTALDEMLQENDEEIEIVDLEGLSPLDIPVC